MNTNSINRRDFGKIDERTAPAFTKGGHRHSSPAGAPTGCPGHAGRLEQRGGNKREHCQHKRAGHPLKEREQDLQAGEHGDGAGEAGQRPFESQRDDALGPRHYEQHGEQFLEQASRKLNGRAGHHKQQIRVAQKQGEAAAHRDGNHPARRAQQRRTLFAPQQQNGHNDGGEHPQSMPHDERKLDRIHPVKRVEPHAAHHRKRAGEAECGARHARTAQQALHVRQPLGHSHPHPLDPHAHRARPRSNTGKPPMPHRATPSRPLLALLIVAQKSHVRIVPIEWRQLSIVSPEPAPVTNEKRMRRRRPGVAKTIRPAPTCAKKGFYPRSARRFT